jgi:hypothetical protein
MTAIGKALAGLTARCESERELVLGQKNSFFFIAGYLREVILLRMINE